MNDKPRLRALLAQHVALSTKEAADLLGITQHCACERLMRLYRDGEIRIVGWRLPAYRGGRTPLYGLKINDLPDAAQPPSMPQLARERKYRARNRERINERNRDNRRKTPLPIPKPTWHFPSFVRDDG